MEPLKGLALLLLCQSAGEALARGLALPLPGPVIGLVLCFGALAVAPLRAPIGVAADGLLAHLSLLFVPVGVGVITHLELVTRHGLALMAVIVLSTWVGMAVTALVLRRMLGGAAAPEARGDG